MSARRQAAAARAAETQVSRQEQRGDSDVRERFRKVCHRCSETDLTGVPAVVCDACGPVSRSGRGRRAPEMSEAGSPMGLVWRHGDEGR